MRFSNCLLPAALVSSVFCSPYFSTTAGTIESRSSKQHPDAKYFSEPGGDDTLSHYDSRYYQKTLELEEKNEALRHLIRAYLITFRENNIETWVAHGTLLGWWWNGRIMPWDKDLDTQVSATTLTWLGDNMNMTTHNYTSVDENGIRTERQYLIDVNTYIPERVRGDGANVIDARFIDVSNGVYTDITGLAEVDPEQRPGIWSCKNYHRYRTRDIWPLRETEFEGVPANVPYMFDKVLTEEYSQGALTKTNFAG